MCAKGLIATAVFLAVTGQAQVLFLDDLAPSLFGKPLLGR